MLPDHAKRENVFRRIWDDGKGIDMGRKEPEADVF
ncbi:hypothetical protein ANO14919_047090 [Xylariales sp. No.14919]|nr:hypothetical protein ANO14919_047090 [Xylariales sp. No.14919]